MASFVSPGISITEINRAATVASASTTNAGFAGVFRWGPVNKISLILNEDSLIAKYGKPSDFNGETWFSAANFLKYSNQLYVSRAASGAFAAIANTGTANAESSTVDNYDELEGKTFSANVQYVAKYPGELGNSLKVSVCDSANQFSSTIDFAANASFSGGNTAIGFSVGSNTATVTLANNTVLTGNTPLSYGTTVHDYFNVGDILKVGNSSIGVQSMKIASVGSVLVQNTAGVNSGYASFTLSFDDIYKLSSDFSSDEITREWEYKTYFPTAPGISNYQADNGNGVADEIHVVIVDEDGKFTNAPGSILEVFDGLSRATDAKYEDGTSNYYKDVLNSYSKYVYAASDRTTAPSNLSSSISASTGASPLKLSFVGGTDGDNESTITVADLATAWDKFQDEEEIDVTLLFTGKSRGGVNGEQLTNYIVDNIAAVRKDCIVFCSPNKNDVVRNSDPALAVKTWADGIRDSSYVALDSGYKYQYDKYNDVYRWVPCNADTAGTMVNKDPWESPAGAQRGVIKNVAKLAWNPATKAERDIIYPARVNPIVTMRAQGTILYGDKTGLSRPSAFDRLNVRHLFIYLEKSIKETSKNVLFELNNEVTRSNFTNAVNPFLRGIKGAGGVYDFKVVCDESNNDASVVDANKFVAQMFIKPSKSINYIDLQFIAVGTDVSFQEVIGAGR